MNKITVGRNPESTIVVQSIYSTVSGSHATIVQNNGAIVFTDHSTNGSTINGRKVHNASCTIARGDRICLGRDYSLNTDQIFSMLLGGYGTGRVPTMHMDNGMTQNYGSCHNYGESQNYGRSRNYDESHHHRRSQNYGDSGFDSCHKDPKCLNKWSWGGFFFGWLWSVSYGIYWPMIELIPFVGWFASLIICFILGANGNKWAWKNYTGTADDFDKSQRSWAIWGLIVFLISIVAAVIMFLF